MGAAVLVMSKGLGWYTEVSEQVWVQVGGGIGVQ